MAKPKKKNKGSKKKSKSKKNGLFGPRFFMVFTLLAAIIMLPSTVLLAAGMLPTLVVAFVAKKRARSRILTIGSLNLSGCTPFLLELWTQENSIEKSLGILTDPKAIVVMYSLAGVGYVVDWALTGIAANFLYQRGVARQEAIEKRMDELIQRWGKKVTGDIPLDEHGFALEQEDDIVKPKEKSEQKR